MCCNVLQCVTMCYNVLHILISPSSITQTNARKFMWLSDPTIPGNQYHCEVIFLLTKCTFEKYTWKEKKLWRFCLEKLLLFIFRQVSNITVEAKAALTKWLEADFQLYRCLISISFRFLFYLSISEVIKYQHIFALTKSKIID